MQDNSLVLYWLIVACEVMFWVAMIAGLAVRYLLRREGISRALLLSLPVIDILLLAFTALDLRAGNAATFAHGLATAYVGFTVAFGSIAVGWADSHFSHRFAAGPAPVKAPDRGWKAVRYDLQLWFRCIVAWVIALSLLSALIAYVGDGARTEPLHLWFRVAFGSILFWFIFGPAWSLLFFRREAK